MWPGACAGGNSKIFSFYFLKWFKSTTACLMALEDLKAFGGKGNVFLVTPRCVKWRFPWGVCIPGLCTENQPRFVSPKDNVAEPQSQLFTWAQTQGGGFAVLSLPCSTRYVSDPGDPRCHADRESLRTVNL